MFLMNWIYALFTVCVLILLGMYIIWAQPETNWGSSTQAQVFVSALRAVRTLSGENPNLLIFTSNAHIDSFQTLLTI